MPLRTSDHVKPATRQQSTTGKDMLCARTEEEEEGVDKRLNARCEAEAVEDTLCCGRHTLEQALWRCVGHGVSDGVAAPPVNRNWREAGPRVQLAFCSFGGHILWFRGGHTI